MLGLKHFLNASFPFSFNLLRSCAKVSVDFLRDTKQLLDEVEYDIVNYQN